MNWIIIISFFFSFLQGIEFTIMNSTAQIQAENTDYENPFLGGFNKPKIQWLDWNNDGQTDLFLLDEDGRLQYFQNSGTGNNTQLKLISSHFQGINCGGWFFFQDFDQDGEFELVTRNPLATIYLSYYENSDGHFILTAESLLTETGGYIASESVVTPTFTDIDNDGDVDFFTGHVIGTVSFYENVGLDNGLPVFTHVTDMWQDIQIIGASIMNARHGASAISFIDLDGDSDLDLSWGDYYQQSLYIVWNEGTAETPNMNIINIDQDFPPIDPIETAGQNMPSFADLDGDDDFDLFITVLGGAYGFNLINNFHFYENVGAGTNPIYLQMSMNFLEVYDIHENASPIMYDIDDDGDLDLFVGNSFETSAFPWNGRIKFFRNQGNNIHPDFILEDDAFLGNLLGKELVPKFADIDNDGDADLFIGELYGGILFFENTGNASIPHFTDYILLTDIDVGYNAVPELCDLDADGDLDLIVGADNGRLELYENTGSQEFYDFQLVNDSWQNIQIGGNSAPQFIDFDMDNDFDLVLGTEFENILVYENLGTGQSPDLVLTEIVGIPVLGKKLKPSFFSSGHGYLDIYTGTSLGGIYHLRAGQCQNGDLTGNLETDVSDIISLVNVVLGLGWDENSLCHGDINADGLLNISDIILIIVFILN